MAGPCRPDPHGFAGDLRPCRQAVKVVFGVAKPASVIQREITDYIRTCGGPYSAWYVGIASDVRQRLFGEHRVDKKAGSWIFRTCASEDVAREIEYYFLDLGADGGPGGGGEDSTFVYAYKKTERSDP